MEKRGDEKSIAMEKRVDEKTAAMEKRTTGLSLLVALLSQLLPIQNYLDKKK